MGAAQPLPGDTVTGSGVLCGRRDGLRGRGGLEAAVCPGPAGWGGRAVHIYIYKYLYFTTSLIPVRLGSVSPCPARPCDAAAGLSWCPGLVASCPCPHDLPVVRRFNIYLSCSRICGPGGAGALGGVQQQELVGSSTVCPQISWWCHWHFLWPQLLPTIPKARP